MRISEEQLDKVIRSLVDSAAADEATISEVVASTAAFRGIQRRIDEQKAKRFFVWPPAGNALRWLMIGGPVAAATILAISFFLYSPSALHEDELTAAVLFANTTPEPFSNRTGTIEDSSVQRPVPALENKQKVLRQNKTASAPAPAFRKSTLAIKDAALPKEAKKEEIKTDFIALSYARDPDSGQIVRVKVPSSMMVSLGLVVSVEKPTDLVDAEVLVGDDGLTRAIRFIR